ncbi:MAG: CDP-glucose 4,6-dehydratase [Acidobacteriota bacterium]
MSGGELAPRLRRAFSGRRVLVTGHTGFKGAWLSAWLEELGAEVSGLALPPATEPSLFADLDLASRLDHREIDLRDRQAVAARVEEVKPEIVLHLAAQALVRESYATPQETFDTNVMGTVNVLEAVRASGRPCLVVVVTSDKCYESTGERPSVEGDPMGGHDPYSASKGATELVVSSYRRSFFASGSHGEHRVGLASVRAGNVIGGGDWSTDRLVPDIVRAVLAEQPPPIRNPQAVRPWQHVLDALSGYLWLTTLMAERGADGLAEAWNFGPEDDDRVSVGQLTDRVLACWQREGWETVSEERPPHETGVLRLDIGKARERLDWRPTWDVDAALAATVDWHRAAAAGEDLRQVTREQLRSYVTTAAERGRAWALAPEGSSS